MTREDYDEEFHLWPDNETSFSLFVQMSSQWRTGMSGATGLEYTSLPFLFDVNGIPRERWKAAFDDLRMMERAALEEMNASQEP